jgi:CelD/BcsL family acetyltransferase involved in cellulose biosynthesis
VIPPTWRRAPRRILAKPRCEFLHQLSACPSRAPDGFDAAYRAKRGSKRRAEHRRRMRRLQESGDAEFTIVRTIEELRPALEEGFRINAMRWEGRPDRSESTMRGLENADRFQR